MQAGQAPKKVSTGGQRKNKFHEIPKAAHHAHQTQSVHHGPTSSKKQYSNSAQRIFSPKSQNQLFKVSNIHKSRHQEDAQPPKHSSAQNFKRKAAESQDLRSQLPVDDQQDGAKSRQQAYSSLSRNSGPNGPSTAMASGGMSRPMRRRSTRSQLRWIPGPRRCRPCCPCSGRDGRPPCR